MCQSLVLLQLIMGTLEVITDLLEWGSRLIHQETRLHGIVGLAIHWTPALLDVTLPAPIAHSVWSQLADVLLRVVRHPFQRSICQSRLLMALLRARQLDQLDAVITELRWQNHLRSGISTPALIVLRLWQMTSGSSSTASPIHFWTDWHGNQLSVPGWHWLRIASAVPSVVAVGAELQVEQPLLQQVASILFLMSGLMFRVSSWVLCITFLNDTGLMLAPIVLIGNVATLIWTKSSGSARIGLASCISNLFVPRIDDVVSQCGINVAWTFCVLNGGLCGSLFVVHQSSIKAFSFYYSPGSPLTASSVTCLISVTFLLGTGHVVTALLIMPALTWIRRIFCTVINALPVLAMVMATSCLVSNSDGVAAATDLKGTTPLYLIWQTRPDEESVAVAAWTSPQSEAATMSGRCLWAARWDSPVAGTMAAVKTRRMANVVDSHAPRGAGSQNSFWIIVSERRQPAGPLLPPEWLNDTSVAWVMVAKEERPVLMSSISLPGPMWLSRWPTGGPAAGSFGRQVRLHRLGRESIISRPAASPLCSHLNTTQPSWNGLGFQAGRDWLFCRPPSTCRRRLGLQPRVSCGTATWSAWSCWSLAALDLENWRATSIRERRCQDQVGLVIHARQRSASFDSVCHVP